MSDGATSTYPDEPQLVYYPHPVLRRVADPVTVFDDALASFARKMFAVMKEHNGVGLAAPQVGVSKRLFITNHVGYRPDAEPEEIVFVNPRIENPVGTEVYEEGCLSFPGIYTKVERPNAFDIVYHDVTGTEHRRHLDVTGGDFLGVVVQHENEHLDGKVFLENASAVAFNLVRRKVKDLEKQFKQQHGKAGAVLRR